ncbi:hypothetical protein ACO2D6_004305 [Escherichia coli]|uniref:Uncharacterized protein n=2 Tax=Escherichia TaxID=561 RepID=A0AAN3IMU1_ECOLX|nr:MULTISPECIES: hypothetical protein [Enterobacteriaceae]EFN8536129.1 hypothetical protein [Escherichia coli O1]MBU4625501.1 hypothetical protein [Shigella sp. GCP5]HDQ6873393.1 hypothetical protein [Escherichia coli O166:H28]EAC1497701.1 hypothetical protein [Escherichia coli]EEC8069799.1 hypothetical protein [Escherichia coli]
MTYGKYKITLSKNNGSYIAKYINTETGDRDELSLSSRSLLLEALQSNLELDAMNISDLREDILAL